MVDRQILQTVVPFLETETRRPRQEKGWRQGQHLNAVNVLDILPEPCGQVHFVLEEDARHVIP